MVFIPTISTRLRITINTTVPPPRRHGKPRPSHIWMDQSLWLREIHLVIFFGVKQQKIQKKHVSNHIRASLGKHFLWAIEATNWDVTEGFQEFESTLSTTSPAMNHLLEILVVFISIVFTWFNY